MTSHTVPKSSSGWRSRGALSPALAITLLAACDPGFTVQGDVLDGAGHAVAGVRFAFTCDGADQDLTETGSDGRFTIGRIGIFDDHCAVVMRPIDRAPTSFPVMANCTKLYTRWFRHDMCSEVTVHAKL